MIFNPLEVILKILEITRVKCLSLEVIFKIVKFSSGDFKATGSDFAKLKYHSSDLRSLEVKFRTVIFS